MQSINRPRHRAATPLPVLTKSQRELMEELMNSVSPPLPVAESQRPLKRNFSNDLQQGSQFCSPQDYSSQDSWVANQNQVQCAQAVGSQDASVPATETPTGSPVSKVSCTPGMEIPEGSPVVNGGATGDKVIFQYYDEYCVKYSKIKLVEERFRLELAPQFEDLTDGITEAQEKFERDEALVRAKAERGINEVVELKNKRARDHELMLRKLAEERSSEERVHQWWMNYWQYKASTQEVNFQAWCSFFGNRQFNSQEWVEDCNRGSEEQMRGHQGYLVNWEYRRGEEERKHKEWMDRFDVVIRELSDVLHHNVMVVQTEFNQAVETANCEIRILRGKIARLQEDWVRYKEGMDSLYRYVAEQEAMEAHLMKGHLEMQMPEVSFIIIFNQVTCPCQ